MNAKKLSLLTLFLIGCSLMAAADQSALVKKQADAPANTKQPPTAAASPTPLEVPSVGKTVYYGEKDIVQIKTRVLNSTMIVLPKTEKILDFVTGDKEYWVINGSENFAYVKPAKAGAQTNLNLITASGNVYTFILKEVSGLPDFVPDLKVFVEPKEQSLIGSASQFPRFVAARDLDDLQHRLDAAQDDLRRQQRATEESVENAVHKFVSRLQFTYRFAAATKPFSVQAIFHDEKFTYIAAHPTETPTLFEIRDGQPNLISFQFENGLYVVHKILDKGYLVIGKHKLEFASEE